MPIYTFKDESGDIYDVRISLSDYDAYIEEHPTHTRYFDAVPSIVSGVSIKDKMDSGFKEVLSRISEAHPTSELADQYGRKTIKQSQTERVVKRWKKRHS